MLLGWRGSVAVAFVVSLPLSWGMPVATSLTEACAVERCFIKFELLTFEVDKVFGLRHNVHITCTFLPFTSTRLKYCLYFHLENAVFDSGLAIPSDIVCVCARYDCVLGLCDSRPPGVSGWLNMKSHSALANHPNVSRLYQREKKNIMPVCELSEMPVSKRVGWFSNAQ